jgi:hypothetical protein
MRRAAGAPRVLCFSTVAGFLLALSCEAIAGAPAQSLPVSAPVDSSLIWRWSAVYRNRLDIVRASEQFPWNDEQASAHLNDRLALLGKLTLKERFALFAKGATGVRLRWQYQEEFVLEQGHAAFKLLGERIQGRLFLRERVFRADTRLMELLSDDASFWRCGGEGLSLAMNAGSHLFVRYIGATVRDSGSVRASDGLPVFRGGADTFHLLRFEALQRERWHAGAMLSQTRSNAYGDAITVGTDVGIRVRGVDLLAELARARRGSWEELRTSSLFDLNPAALSFDRPSSLFSGSNAFSTEADGLDVPLGDAGSAGIVPGYRYSGNGFVNPQGEVEAGISETYAVVWWKPAQYDALLSIEAVEGSRGNEEIRRLTENLRLAYRGGFELKEGIVCSNGKRASAIVSLLNDTKRSRVRMTARIDELGSENELSYLAESGINFGPSLTAKGAVYLHRSRTNYYSVGFEFRPRERFLFRLALGSFVPTYEDILLTHSFEFEPPLKERSILLSSRIWFGGM